MTQFWTITEGAATNVIAPCVITDGPTNHPKDAGFPWKSGGVQKATQISQAPDLLRQRFDGAVWIADMDRLRARRWDEVKAARDRAEWGGCTTSLGRVQTDDVSQRKTAGAVQMAMIAQAAGQPFAIEWTMADNTVVAHDAGAMIALGVAVGLHVAACHEAAILKRRAIEQAVDDAALAAINIEEGWPDA